MIDEGSVERGAILLTNEEKMTVTTRIKNDPQVEGTRTMINLKIAKMIVDQEKNEKFLVNEVELYSNKK